jgi:hypothetical protein
MALPKNVQLTLEGKKLTIVVPDITTELGVSSSGKAMLHASASGPITPDGRAISFNLYTPIPKESRK